MTLVKYLDSLVEDKSVALVGGGPSLLSKKFGKDIDSKDVVIRLNLRGTECLEGNVGSRTDLRIIGANLEVERNEFIDDFFTPVSRWANDPILTTEHNKPLLSLMQIPALYYNRHVPRLGFDWAKSLVDLDVSDHHKAHPFTTGVTMMLLLLVETKVESLHCFGFSSCTDEMFFSLDDVSQTIVPLDADRIASNHTPVEIENKLVSMIGELQNVTVQ